MPERFEADTVLLNIVAGRPASDEPPGLATFAAPRRAARGRERDALFLCLSLRARAPLPAERYAELLNLAAATFFGTPGSVTAAARQALLALNQRLLEANLREGAPVQGSLICAILHGAEFYAVQCGAGAVLVGHALNVERFPGAASRPLGLSNALDAQYFHTAVSVGDYVALSSSANWSESGLAGLGGLATLSAAAERLKSAAGGDFSALLARIEPAGTTASASAPQPAPILSAPPASPAAPASAPPATPAAGLPNLGASLSSLSDRVRSTFRPTVEAPPDAPLEPEAPAPVEAEVEAPLEAPPPAAPRRTDWQGILQRMQRITPEEEAAPPPLTAEEAPPVIEREPAGRPGLGATVQNGLRSFGRAIGVTLTEMTRSLRRLAARALPEGTALQQGGLFTIPTSVQIGIAVVIPLIIVAVAALVYIQQGQAQQFDESLNNARVAVAKGRLTADPLAARPHWEEALRWTEAAAQLRPGEPTVALLQQEAQTRLDELDWAQRVTYQPLLGGGLGADVELTQLVLAGRDVYVLDARGKRVHRLTLSNSGSYFDDPTFRCASGNIGPLTIGPLIDIGFLPGPNVRDADSLVALDTAGGLIYCAPNEGPLGSYLPAPETGWIQPVAMEIYAERLYVLDVGRNQIWQFDASGGAYNQPPSGYFTEFVYDLKDVVDFAIAGGDVMLLHRDGRMSLCNRTQPSGTAVCTQPAPFTDNRPGRASGDRLNDVTAPVHLIYDQPPEPSVFILDGETSALHQLSLKLLFVRQFRPAAPLSGPIGAVAIDQAKRFFVAAGSNVYVAVRP
jgi:hypothetical protein